MRTGKSFRPRDALDIIGVGRAIKIVKQVVERNAVPAFTRAFPMEARIPRYFFDLDDHQREPDEDGYLLDSPEEARIQAVIFAGAYLRDNPALLDDGKRFMVDVRDDAGAAIVWVVVFTEQPD